MSGVIYYKLAEKLYPGDSTKGCGLTGPEIDGNFNFLRGYDIESGRLDPETGIITLVRLNGEEITIDGLSDILSGLTTFDLEGSHYDPSDGTLYLVVNGQEQSGITGFFTHKDIHVDCSLEGNGSEENPLKISEEFIDGIDKEIEDAVSEEREAREEACRALAEAISIEAENRADADEGLVRAINAETNERREVDNELAREIAVSYTHLTLPTILLV